MHGLRSFCEAWDGGIGFYQKLDWFDARDTMYRCVYEKMAIAE